MNEETIQNTEGARTFLRAFSSEIFTGCDLKNPTHQKAFRAAESLVDNVTIADGTTVSAEELTRQYIGVLYRKSELVQLTAEVMNSLTDILSRKTADASNSHDVLRYAEQKQYVNSGAFAGDLAMANTILFSAESAESFIGDAYEWQPNESHIALVDDVIAHGNDYPSDSTIIVMKRDSNGNRFALGIERDVNGHILKVGVSSINAPCRIACYDRISREQGTGVEYLKVEARFEDYPEGISNPYAYPDDLFMLKSSAYWGAIDISDSKVVTDALQQRV